MTAPAQPVSSGPAAEPLVYRIDAAGCITFVNMAWQVAACQAAADSVMPGRVQGRELLGCFEDQAVRDIYKAIVARVRTGRVMHFDYRCDLADRRRTFAMTIRPLLDGAVEFTTVLTEGEARPAVALFRDDQRRDPERFVRMCSWCQRVALADGTWVQVEEAMTSLHLADAETLPRITHGMCAECSAAMWVRLIPKA